jgi:hypothetical protein
MTTTMVGETADLEKGRDPITANLEQDEGDAGSYEEASWTERYELKTERC